MKINRIMLAAPSSGSGKTLITCGLLNLMKRHGIHTASFKCGPDFIDPMFHSRVLGTESHNLDTFFSDKETVRYLLARNAEGADMAVIEGVMGYYDGISPDSSRAGASDLADITGTPVFLIVPARGTSRSILPLIRGFLDFQEKSCIKGVILNQISPSLYPSIKKLIEEELGIVVAGYLPVMKDCSLESRHLGLLMPDEIDSLQKKLDLLSDRMEETMDLSCIMKIAGEAKELPAITSDRPTEHGAAKYRIGLARDEAFCFFYQDNLTLLEDMGAELVPFSPIHDRELPPDLDGLLLHGGYPELYAENLSRNRSMLFSVREAINSGLPTIAECGGFLYLHEHLKDITGNSWPMAGVFKKDAFYTGHLTRFGYITLSGGKAFGTSVGDIRSHEFHYYESEDPGDDFLAVKPSGTKSWRCIHSTDTLFAGFPHLYYYANKKLPEAFLACCRKRLK